jgi:hypothetical protein
MKQTVNGLKLAAILLVIFMFSACTFHIPYDWEWDSPVIRVRLLVQPDDADVLLNGKWIGEAYEFSTFETAIRLASRNNEIIVKKEGYVEEAVNLYEYSSKNITVRLRLSIDKDYTGPVQEKKPVKKPGAASKKPEYKAKTDAEPKPPQDLEEKGREIAVEPVEVVLEILPEESSIYLNGKFWGISPKNEKIENLRLIPGKYTLEVVKPGYRSYKKELDIKDQKVELSIHLEKEK